jgi:NodT family efflux transporter outer membrane factor (OMF) lipoprotein
MDAKGFAGPMNARATLFRAASALALAGLSAGCVTMPHERPTPPPLPAAWTEAKTLAGGDETAALENWWTGFHDPLLNQLVAEGLTRSATVRQAALRVTQARAQSQQTLGAYAPQISGQARGQFTRSINGPPLIGAGGAEVEQGIGSYGATVSWEIPLFARIHAASIGAKANTRGALADERGAKVALAADVAQAYVDLRTAQNRRAALGEAADLAAELARILRTSADAGITAEADAQDALREAESDRAQVADAEVQTRSAINRLSLLRARAPGTEDPALEAKLEAADQIPTIELAGAPAAPADLIRLRPDVAGAEADAIVAAAQVGISRTDILPRLNLTGSILGSRNIEGAALAENSLTGALTPLITIPLLDWGTHAAAVRANKAAFQSALIQYQSTVNQGVSEASNALTQLSQGAERLEAAKAAEAAAEITARGRRAAYDAGISSLTDRLRADQQLLAARLTRIQAESQSASAAIAVYRAFGGGPPDMGK